MMYWVGALLGVVVAVEVCVVVRAAPVDGEPSFPPLIWIKLPSEVLISWKFPAVAVPTATLGWPLVVAVDWGPFPMRICCIVPPGFWSKTICCGLTVFVAKAELDDCDTTTGVGGGCVGRGVTSFRILMGGLEEDMRTLLVETDVGPAVLMIDADRTSSCIYTHKKKHTNTNINRHNQTIRMKLGTRNYLIVYYQVHLFGCGWNHRWRGFVCWSRVH